MISKMVADNLASSLPHGTGSSNEDERLLRAAAELLPQMVWIASGDGLLEYANPRWLFCCGFRNLEENVDWRCAIHPDDLPEVNRQWARAVASGQCFEAEARFHHAPDRDYRWFLCQARPLRPGDPHSSRWLGTCTDIHQTKLKAEDLSRAKAELESINNERDQFLSAISHELRTPLNAILGWTHLLQMNMLELREVKEAVDSIEQNAKAQAQLVEDMLDVSRAVNNKLRIDPRLLDARTPVWAAIETIRPMADLDHVQLHVCFPDCPVWVEADQQRLQQIVWNLLSNAVKFTDPGGEVHLTLEVADGHARILVRDSGRGIAPEMLDRVFERFVQIESPGRRRHIGLGLGLSIVRHLVDLHGGQVYAASEGVGKGATFTVTLPLHPSQQRTATADATGDRPGFSPAMLKGIRVLVIDDETFSRRIIATTLHKAGAETRSAASAREGYSLLADFAPHVVVCDIGMPDEDGYAFAARLRKAPDPQVASTPAIALTGYAGLTDRERALNAGFSRHVAKPVSPAELVQAVLQLVPRA